MLLLDCEELANTEGSKRRYSDKLRASPWQVNKGGGDEEEEEGSSSCARRLFFRKEKRGVSKENQEVVTEVIKQLEEVSLSLLDTTNQGVTRGEQVGKDLEEVETVETYGEVVITHEREQTPLTFEAGTSQPKTRGLKKVQKIARRKVEGASGGVVCGKRKDAMEIDEEYVDEGGTGGKKTKADDMTGPLINAQVAEVAVQPREQQ